MSRVLDSINSPQDVKRLPVSRLPALAGEVREELISTVAGLGGHLASSLGAVELCLALHYVFEAPNDHLVWDMGYQAYTHKLITGRRDRIRTLKQFKGLTGFNNKDESPYDLFTTGHGGTCLSTAMGLSIAQDRAQEKRQVVAIIGDASLGEGMALEALNHIGHVKPNMLVILNDNKWSIAPPVGGLSRYLNRIITNPLYNRIHHDLAQIIRKLPKGANLVRIGQLMEESLKGFLTPGMLFEELGFRYVGPIDGHDFGQLIATLRNVKKLKGPTLMHVMTRKGKGYRPAERDPEHFHKTEPFDIATGRSPRHKSAATFTDAFGDELLKLAQSDERIIAITAAMPEGTGVGEFGRKFPDRYFDVGMAEQHGLGLAAGLARAGQQPVVALYSTFLQRAYDQIMHELSLQNLPVILAIDRGGLVGEDGPTHHGMFDIGYLRPLPNMVVMSPKDPEELRAMLRWAVDAPGPVALRYSRGGIVGEPLAKSAKITLGKSEVLRQGKDLAIIALGSLVYPALDAAARLKQDGVDATVINARFVKPLDLVLLRQVATHCNALVTLEEGAVAGGFGSAVSEALEAMGLHTVPLLRVGLPDEYIEQGKRAELLKLCRLDADGLLKRIGTWYSTLKAQQSEASSLLSNLPE